ncbi:MAG: MFS transporter [Deltaproteobacteria bacterium]|nr:MFS transporter [Deltaproteobacteria bacterium]
MTQVSLLRSRRFAGLFWAQLFGAFNDNLFKNALVILIAYQGASIFGLGSEQLVAVSGAVFILPFVLFSATAGQLADRYAKSALVRWTKLGEIAIMALAAAGFVTGHLGLLFLVLFLIGCQASLFGPVKYSILPQLLDDDELVGGNALVETGTFLAILLGTIAGGIVIGAGEPGRHWLAGLLLAIAAAGFAASWLVPRTAAENPTLPIAANPFVPLRETVAVTRANRTVFNSVLGVSWFWLFGAAILALLPIYTKDLLRADEHVITLFLALFCAGIAIGSLLCERLSDRKLELGLVPLGSIGMSVFAFDLFLSGAPTAGAAAPGGLIDIGGFLAHAGSWRILFDLLMLAIASGFFIVPLNTLIQQRAAAAERSRVVAGANILSALFMVLASVLLVACFALGLSALHVFALLAVLNAAVAIYIYQLIPEFLLRFVCWIVANCMYRLRTVNRENIPMEGAALLVCNHVSFVDWMIVASACKRPARFVMYHGFLKMPLVGWLFRDAKVIPISPAREDEQLMDAAFDRIAEELAAGELVCIFPEGAITKDGALQRFRPGVEKIVRRTPVPVIPLALVGLWGSFFSRKGGAAMRRPFRRVWSRIQVVVGTPVPPEQVTADDLAARVAALAGLEPPAIPAAAPPS